MILSTLSNYILSFAAKITNEEDLVEIYQEVCQQLSYLALGVMQEHHFATLQRETERLRTDIDKMRSELRYAPSQFLLSVLLSRYQHLCLIVRQLHILSWGLINLCDYICRYEIDKVTAGQRLDLNLERG
jgi:hypothetical protein